MRRLNQSLCADIRRAHLLFERPSNNLHLCLCYIMVIVNTFILLLVKVLCFITGDGFLSHCYTLNKKVGWYSSRREQHCMLFLYKALLQNTTKQPLFSGRIHSENKLVHSVYCCLINIINIKILSFNLFS